MTLRDSIPPQLKTAGRRVARAVGAQTSGLRMLPEALLVGTQRGGTTSMHRALIAHPAVLPPVLTKGVNYFDINYERGIDWYRAHFPLRATARLRASLGHDHTRPITLESSGYYMFHPLAAGRIATDLPGVKVIVTLRNPVERAWSAHRHEFNRGFDPEPDFERALDLEAERTEGEAERLCADPHYVSFSHRHHAYLHRGEYASQMKTLFDALGRDRVHVVFSEEFLTFPEREFERLLRFVGLPPWRPPVFGRFNPSNAAPLPDALRMRLVNHFEPHDAALTELLGVTPPWRR